MDGAGDECHGEDEVHTGRAMKDDGHEDHRALASIYDGKAIHIFDLASLFVTS